MKILTRYNKVTMCFSLAVLLLMTLSGCDKEHLRGAVKKSEDGNTYLAVVDDNGGKCGPIYVDGKEWKYKIGEPGPISPGTHFIKCGTEIEFEIPKGVIFQFNYWGP